MTCPRELSLRDGKLCQQPVRSAWRAWPARSHHSRRKAWS
ncbi:Sucrose-6-phosphate hydrolase [Cronobacter malonaticus 507]|nr:Sucrose-6-phosphate hydrolase [Cronobacter malonaticus 507]